MRCLTFYILKEKDIEEDDIIHSGIMLNSIKKIPLCHIFIMYLYSKTISPHVFLS